MGFSAPSFAFDEVHSDTAGDVSMRDDDPGFDEPLRLSPGEEFSEGKTSTPSEGRTSDASQERQPDSPPHSTKFDWNAVFGEEPSHRRESQSNATAAFDVSKGMSNADAFSFYSMSHQGNDWAGARHWKFALRPRARPVAAVAEATVVPPPKAKKAKKERKPLVFTAEPVDESMFDEKPRAGGHSLSETALKKNAELSKQGTLLLPPDAQLETRDLCRLFLRPRMIVVPEALSSMLRPKEKTTQRRDPFVRDEVLVWGEIQILPPERQFESNYPPLDTAADDNGDYLYEADEEFTGDEIDGNSVDPKLEVPSASTKGLEIRLSDMAQAGRRAQKIDISYATSSKRVNVGKLKRDLWERLETTMAPKNLDRSDESPDGSVSFQDVVAGFGGQQKQSDATLPFYFICLLHLANEKVIHIIHLMHIPLTQSCRIW